MSEKKHMLWCQRWNKQPEGAGGGFYWGFQKGRLKKGHGTVHLVRKTSNWGDNGEKTRKHSLRDRKICQDGPLLEGA